MLEEQIPNLTRHERSRFDRPRFTTICQERRAVPRLVMPTSRLTLRQHLCHGAEVLMTATHDDHVPIAMTEDEDVDVRVEVKQVPDQTTIVSPEDSSHDRSVPGRRQFKLELRLDSLGTLVGYLVGLGRPVQHVLKVGRESSRIGKTSDDRIDFPDPVPTERVSKELDILNRLRGRLEVAVEDFEHRLDQLRQVPVAGCVVCHTRPVIDQIEEIVREPILQFAGPIVEIETRCEVIHAGDAPQLE